MSLWGLSKKRRSGQTLRMLDLVLLLLEGPLMIGLGTFLLFINRPYGPPFGF
jgi:hypothetical protein